MKEALVFVCYSALSFDAARRVCQLAPSAKSFLFALFPLEGNYPEFTQVYSMATTPRRMSEWTKPFAIARWFRDSLDRLDRNDLGKLRVFVSHPFELPANHFIYSDPRVSTRELLPDGLLNYTLTHFRPTALKHRARYELRASLRSVAARLFRLKYRRLLPGHLTQYEFVDYDRTWTDNRKGFVTSRIEPTLLPSEGESKPLTKVDAPLVLVLDQELAPLVEPKLAEKMRSTLLIELSRIGAKRVLYKAHPRGVNRERLFRREGVAIENVTGPELAERVARSRGVTHLIGFYSTPLLLMEDVATRLCILPEAGEKGVKNPTQLREYSQAFERSGAQVRFVVSSK